MGNTKVLVGLQFGDEGKARVMDKILDDYDIVARFQGGANAGHTLEVEGKRIALHQIPSGIFHKNCTLYIGSGCVLNPEKTIDEILDIQKQGINIADRLKISARTTLVQPHHVQKDCIEGIAIGTTMNGIGQAYASIAQRKSGDTLHHIQLGTYLSNPKKYNEQIKDQIWNFKPRIDINKLNKLANDFDSAVKSLEQYVVNDPMFLEKKVKDGSKVFYEGANAIMLDPVMGTVPFVTSGRTLAAHAYVGGDLNIKHHGKVIGVAKAIMSRVGNGPFISEFGKKKSENYCADGNGYSHVKEKEKEDYIAEQMLNTDDHFNIGIGLRMLGNEYGATTKRPRRIGMLDLVMLRQNCQLNGVDALYINKFDCLNQFSMTKLPGIPIVTGYMLKGKEIDYIPGSLEDSYKAKPIIEYHQGFSEDISGIRNFFDLPDSVKSLVNRIEEYVGTPIFGIGVGPKRDEFIKINEKS